MRRLREGHAQALDEVVPLLYGELRRIARENLRRERRGHTLATTALVHEVYLRLIDNRRISVADRAQFFGAASLTMRRILADYARTRKRLKRGAGVEPIPLDEATEMLSASEADEILALDDAVVRLERVDPRAAQVVQLRFFGGLDMQEIAGVLDISERTARRDWISARAWLRHEVATDLGLSMAVDDDERREA